jgi:hypothetical protein
MSQALSSRGFGAELDRDQMAAKPAKTLATTVTMIVMRVALLSALTS